MYCLIVLVAALLLEVFGAVPFVVLLVALLMLYLFIALIRFPSFKIKEHLSVFIYSLSLLSLID